MQVACGCEVHFQDHDKRLVLKRNEDLYRLENSTRHPSGDFPFLALRHMDPDEEIKVDFSPFLIPKMLP
jgi:hypothetical protein